MKTRSGGCNKRSRRSRSKAGRKRMIGIIWLSRSQRWRIIGKECLEKRFKLERALGDISKPLHLPLKR
jgi:hypothetical protein